MGNEDIRTRRAVVTAPEASSTASGRVPRLVFGTVLLSLLVVYSLTAQWTLPYHIDAITNAITGWYIGNEGTFIAHEHQVLTEPEYLRNIAWFVDSPSGPVSQYPPGTALWTGVFYALTPGELETAVLSGTNQPDIPPVEVPVPPLWPATLSAVFATALTAAILALVCFRLSGERRSAITAGLTFGLATTAWTVASTMSWTHGVAMLAVAAALLALQSQRWLLGGAALAFAVVSRPHLAVVAALVGVGISTARRQLKPALLIGASSSIGLAGLFLYNFLLWRRVSFSGGYGGAFRDQFLGSSIGWFLENVWRGLFDVNRGLLVWAPFLLVLIFGLVKSRKSQPEWALWAAVGGAAYLLVQWRANRFSGGEGHFAYRYPLEMLTAATPALYVGYTTSVRPRWLPIRALGLGLAAALVGQVLHAF